MGCFWSCEDRDYCIHCNRAAVNDLQIIDNVCEICLSRSTKRPSSSFHLKARFGEYRCSSCGRYWTSRLSWARCYQVCKRCRTHVYAYNQRDLLPSDMTHAKDGMEHQKEYCQMCQQLGHYCANYGNNGSAGRPVGKKSRRYGRR